MAHLRAVALFVAVVALTSFGHARLREAVRGERVGETGSGVDVRVLGPGAMSCLERGPRGGGGLCWLEPAPGARLAVLEENGVDRTAAVRAGEYPLAAAAAPVRIVARFTEETGP